MNAFNEIVNYPRLILISSINGLIIMLMVLDEQIKQTGTKNLI